MTKYEFLSAVGEIEPELIEKSETFRNRHFRKNTAIILAAALIIAFSVTAAAGGFFGNAIKDMNISAEAPNGQNGYAENFVFSFDVDIPEDAGEFITEYYLPTLLIESGFGYNASANSLAVYLYWENEKKEFIAFSQHSAVSFDYSMAFSEDVIIEESEFYIDRIKTNYHEVFSAESEKPLYKMYHWSDGYNVFSIECSFGIGDDFIVEVIKSIEKIEDFSEYGKIRKSRFAE